jgi:hypothetical protein
MIIIPVGFMAGFMFRSIISSLIPAGMNFSLLICNAGTFTLFFITMILMIDTGFRKKSAWLANKYVIAPILRLKRA